MMTVILFGLALVLAASAKHGGKMFFMCLIFFIMDRSCESESFEAKISAEKRACQLEDFPDAIGVKLYREGKFEGVYSVLCIDAKGGLHVLPKWASGSEPQVPRAEVPAPAATDTSK